MGRRLLRARRDAQRRERSRARRGSQVAPRTRSHVHSLSRYMRPMRHAALMLGVLLVARLPGDVSAQNTTSAFQDSYVDVNGVRLHSASVGKGPLILFLHGYPSFWYQWKDQMTEMGRDHT